MLMLLDGILVLSGLSCKRQRIWYCIESIAIDRARVDHIDLEVNVRVRFPQGITQTIVCYRGLLGSQRLTGLTWLPCDIVEDYQERGILIAMRIPTREHFARETQSFGEGWGNI